MIDRFRHRRDSAAPGLLVAFVSATLAMVLAIVVLLRGDSDWVDFVRHGQRWLMSFCDGADPIPALAGPS